MPTLQSWKTGFKTPRHSPALKLRAKKRIQKAGREPEIWNRGPKTPESSKYLLVLTKLQRAIVPYLLEEKRCKMDRLVKNGNFILKFLDYDWSTHDKVNAVRYKKGDLISSSFLPFLHPPASDLPQNRRWFKVWRAWMNGGWSDECWPGPWPEIAPWNYDA